MGKPPYRVPSMAEIASIPHNGFVVASLFAGCGGSSLGYRMAGFKVALAAEFVPAAQESYRANAAPGTVVWGGDVRDLTGSEFSALTGIATGDLDVLDGSPPCQAFSTSGKRDKGWGTDKRYEHGATQRNEDLFFDFCRVRDEIMPRAFVAENVSGLVKGKAKGYFLEILRRLKVGYRVEARLLDAQWLGVPQQRERVIFVGVREDLGVDPAFPAPLPYRYSVRDALPWIAEVGGIRGTGVGAGKMRSSREPCQTLMAQGGGGMNTSQFGCVVEREALIDGTAIGREYDALNPGQQSGRYFSLVRADPARPCPTITASGGSTSGIASVVHPTEKRKFTIAELKRIGSFPDDFVLTGTFAQQWERIGNSVPPVMMLHVAREVRDRVLAPAAARTAAPGPRSPDRSTIGLRRTGGGTRRPTRRRPAGT